MTAQLPQGYSLRRPTLDDIPALTDLAVANNFATLGEQDTVEEDVRSQLMTTDVQHDAWVVLAPDGHIVSSAFVSSNDLGKFFAEITVHPDVKRQGIGTSLRVLIEARANERMSEAAADARISLNGGVYHGDTASQRFVEHAGMTHIRSFWRMEIALMEQPPAPVWPAHISIQTFQTGQEHAVYEADDEAFQDHWGHSPRPFDDWLRWSIQREDFDQSLWFLAMDGEQIAGAALCWAAPFDNGGLGWVGQLWVRRPWRRHGLGLALLHHAFGEFYRRGFKRVVLGVDSQSLTGATRLYERAGMHAAHQWDTYQKELRPGTEYTTTELVESHA